jgi:hypothetical protein
MNIQSIGRENIFSNIKEIILREDGVCHFVPLIGKGGSGKTMLFNQIQKYFEDHADQYPDVIVINYDYRDLKSQSLAGTLYLNICKMLQNNEKLFQPTAVKLFFRMLLNVPERLDGLLNFAISQVKYLLKTGVRLVLLEDTVETINAPSDYIKNIFKMGSYLPNCVAIVAGRPEDNTLEHLDVINTTLRGNNWNIHPPVELSSFTHAETEKFLQLHFGSTLSKDLVDKIHLLTYGSPIHLAIVTEVINQNANLAILSEDLEALKRQSTRDRAELMRRFEYDLVAEISHLGTKINWTILYLAYLNRRYDRKIIRLLMGSSDLEIDVLERKYKSLLFLRKSALPSRETREILHDEIQRMINSLIWEQIDFMKENRKAITHKVIDGYYTPEIKNYQKKILEMSNNWSDLDQLMRYMDNLFALAELQNECLDYLLRIDEANGAAYFYQLAEEVNQSRFPNFNRMLLYDGVKNIGLSRFIPLEDIQSSIYNH